MLITTTRCNDIPPLYPPTLDLVTAIVGVDRRIVLGIHDPADRAAEIVLLRYGDVEDFRPGCHNCSLQPWTTWEMRSFPR